MKRAKAVGDILEHFSEHSSQVKAELVSKIIDREGANFGQNVFQNSKVLKEMNQLDREDTVGLMTGTRSSEYLWRQSRTAFNKNLGLSPISKGKGCSLLQLKTQLLGTQFITSFLTTTYYNLVLGVKT